MVLSLNNMKLRTKLLLIAIVALLGVVIVGAESLFALKAKMLEEKHLKTMNLVETSYGVVDCFYKLSQNGKASEEDAKAAAIAAIKGVRYDEKEYFWINDMHPTMISGGSRTDFGYSKAT